MEPAGIEHTSPKRYVSDVMNIEWDYTAEVYLDQLPLQERARVVHTVDKLATEWARLEGGQLQRLSWDDLYALRVGGDLRVLVRRQDDVVVVVDVIRRAQIDSLRASVGTRQAAAG